MYFIRQQPTWHMPPLTHTGSHWHHPRRPLHVVLYQPDWNIQKKRCIEKKTATPQRATATETPECRVLYNMKSDQVTDDADRFELILDVPGVKVEDITIKVHDDVLFVSADRKARDDNCTMVARYEKRFALDESIVDAASVTATLTNGVLCISAPKKQKQPAGDNATDDVEQKRSVTIKAGAVPERKEANEDRFELTVDVPGIKLDDLKVDYRDGTLNVQGERKHHSRLLSLRRQFLVDTKKTDVTSFEAFLENGVLTIIASRKQVSSPTIIVVQEGASTTVETPNENEVEPSALPETTTKSSDEKNEVEPSALPETTTRSSDENFVMVETTTEED